MDTDHLADEIARQPVMTQAEAEAMGNRWRALVEEDAVKPNSLPYESDAAGRLWDKAD